MGPRQREVYGFLIHSLQRKKNISINTQDCHNGDGCRQRGFGAFCVDDKHVKGTHARLPYTHLKPSSADCVCRKHGLAILALRSPTSCANRTINTKHQYQAYAEYPSVPMIPHTCRPCAFQVNIEKQQIPPHPKHTATRPPKPQLVVKIRITTSVVEHTWGIAR